MEGAPMKKTFSFYVLLVLLLMTNLLLTGFPKVTLINFGIPIIVVFLSWMVFSLIESKVGGFQNKREAFYYWILAVLILLVGLFLILKFFGYV
ncbi:putative membrane protein [Streptococcus uberis 0140J]|uniref:Membrane protein n=2 Tax=Streptococcus uberis TaxID=1349 RepID=B9DVP0_STRU0|nr:putative membrane protein [Streptococcus uberis 0140J]